MRKIVNKKSIKGGKASFEGTRITVTELRRAWNSYDIHKHYPHYQGMTQLEFTNDILRRIYHSRGKEDFTLEEVKAALNYDFPATYEPSFFSMENAGLYCSCGGGVFTGANEVGTCDNCGRKWRLNVTIEEIV